MNEKFTISKVLSRRAFLPGVLFLLTFCYSASAQVASLPANTLEPYSNPKSPALSIETSGGSNWTTPNVLGIGTVNPGNVISASTTDFTSLVPVIVGGGTQRVTINLNEGVSASAANPYFVGFDLLNSGLLDLSLSDLLGAGAGFRIKLYDGATLVYTYEIDKAKLLGLLGVGLLTNTGEKARIGFTFAPATAASFNRVMFEQSTVSLLAIGTTQLYNLVLGRYVSANYSTALDCNTNNVMGAPDYPFGVVAVRTSDSGVINPYGALSGTGFTEIGGLESALGGGINYAVGDVFGNDLNAGGNQAFVGFDLENSNLLGLLNVGLLSNYTISLYKDGLAVPGGSFSGGDLLATNLTLLAGTGRVTVGFMTNLAFDEVILNINTALSTASTKVHGVVLKPFCAASGPDVLACNELSALTNPQHPLFINGLRTGTEGLLNVGTIINTENIINGSASPATLTTVAGVAGSVSVSVGNALETYPAGSFAGFQVESADLLNASVLGNSGIKIELYDSNSGTPNVPVFVSSGNILAGVGVLGGSNTHIIGVVSPVAFDEVRLVIDKLVAATVGTYNVQGVYFQKACDEALECFTDMLSQETHGAVINADKTGVSLAVNASLGDEAMEQPWNAVSASTADFASMNALAGVLSTTSLSVAATAYTFPAGTFAGFEVSHDGGLIDIGALGNDNIIIELYNNGVPAGNADFGNNGLLDLTLLSSGTGRSVLGFYSTNPFDEIQIRLTRTVNVGTDYSLNVYGAVVSTRYVYENGGLDCVLRYIRPDQNTGYINTPIPGNAATNDDLPFGGTYTSVGTPTVPGGSIYTFHITPHVTYTFQTDTPGTYTFNIQVCVNDIAGDCPIIPLTIHVLERGAVNPPVGYKDFAVVEEGSSNNIIPVKDNDIPGNDGGTLGTPTVVTPPSNGSVSFNGNGEAVYTPSGGFTGRDSFTYTVCETPSNECTGPVEVTVYVQAITDENTTLAVDDQFIGPMNQAVSGNVLANDYDAEGDDQDVALIDLDGDGTPETVPTGAAQDVLQGGVKVGTITVDAETGDIVFTPETGYKGTVNVAIRIVDAQGATSQSTVVLVIVEEVPDLSPTIQIFSTEFLANAERDFIVNVWELNNGNIISGGQPVVVKVLKNQNFDITVPGLTLSASDQDGLNSQSVYGATNILNSNGEWTFREDVFAIYVTVKSSVTLTRASDGKVGILGFHIKRKAGATTGVQNLSVEILPGSGGETNTVNNNATRKLGLN